MAGDELLACRGCGLMFVAPPRERGPRAMYCGAVCRQRSYRQRILEETAAATADLARASTHHALAVALAALPPSSVATLRELLLNASDRNLSLARRDGLCTSDTPSPAGVVVDVHKEAL